MHERISRRALIALTGTASMGGLIASRRLFVPARAADIVSPQGKITVVAAGPGESRTRILVINPNTSQKTTDMMVHIAQSVAPDTVEVIGATAPRGPSMIVEPAGLAAAAPQVVEIGVAQAKDVSGIIVSAFGDPGVGDLRKAVSIPVVGIAESAMFAASANGRRFGVATTTPNLVSSIDAKAAELGLAKLYTGTRLTSGDPLKLSADPAALVEALRQAVAASIEQDKAEAVIIGGGPLGNAATALQPMFSVPVIAPIPEAVHRIMGKLGAVQKS